MTVSSPIDMSNFDLTVPPQDSFYRHVNGNWIKKTVIPADKAAYQSFTELDDKCKENLKALFEDFVTLPEGDSKAAEIYISGMDTEAIEKAGLAPVKDLLDGIASIETLNDVAKHSAILQRLGTSPFFGLYSSSDSRKSSVNALHALQGGLGLPDRDYYFDDSKQAIIDAYKSYLVTLMTLSGENETDAKTASEAIFEFEKSLASVSLPLAERRDPVKTYNKVPVSVLQEKAKSINWESFFEILGIKSALQGDIILENVEYFSKMSDLVQNAKISTLKAYLKAKVLNSSAPFLSDAFVKAAFNFNEKTLTGAQELKPRWKRVIEFCGSQVRDIVGEAYVAKHFTAEAKKSAREMVSYIEKAFEHRIKTVEWMQDATRQKALMKLSKFRVKIGYPDVWINYDALNGKISRNNAFFTNIRAASEFNTLRDLHEFDKPVDREKWHMPPYMVNAYFNPTMNEIVFPAAILSEPFFYAPTSDLPLGQAAMSFGGIGAVIAHEISHGYDDQGRQFNAEGNLEDWWLEQDGKNFDARAEKIIAQFSKYQLLGKNVNGKLTQGENIADLGGLSISYAAFQNFMKEKGRDQLPANHNFTQEQQFFISWAQIWRGVMRDDLVLQRLITDPHSPNEFRVTGPLANLPEFHQAFNVKPGDKMYAPEEERVSIW